jgi:hypothetical protein
MSTQNTAIQRAIALLNATGAKFKVITVEGVEFGTLVVSKEPTLKKRSFTANKDYPRGERTAYVRALLEPMKIGDSIVVTDGPYKGAIASLVPPTAQTLWGKQSYITAAVDGGVEILRVL